MYIANIFQKFLKAADDVKNLKSKPSDEDLLEIYSLFKQGSIGDVNTSKLLFYSIGFWGLKDLII